jgi:hemoglobin-like flavoprotein
LQLFPFRDQPLETLFLNAKVRLHCKLFADTVSQTVGSLGDSVAVKASLRELGARHCDQYKVRSGHYAAMGSALLEVLEHNLGESWDEETKTAWEETWAYITKQMQKGAGSRDVSQRGVQS